MKTLTITQDNSRVSKSDTRFYLGENELSELICKSLPEGLVNYRDYVADVSISITLHDASDIAIVATGYDLPKEDEETESEE